MFYIGEQKFMIFCTQLDFCFSRVTEPRIFLSALCCPSVLTESVHKCDECRINIDFESIIIFLASLYEFDHLFSNFL
jgi:hypothetical protein